MDAVSQRVLEYLTEVEEVAEDVLTTKQQIVDLDAKRNRNREALNALKHEVADSEKVKVCLGSMFIKFSKSKTTEMIQKDQEQLDNEINDLRKGLKAKVNRLNEMQVLRFPHDASKTSRYLALWECGGRRWWEHRQFLRQCRGKPELRGYSLSPLSTDEIKAINSLLKR